MGVVRTVYKGEVETGVVAWFCWHRSVPSLFGAAALQAHFGTALAVPKLTQISRWPLQDSERALCFCDQLVALQHIRFDDQRASPGVDDLGDT